MQEFLGKTKNDKDVFYDPEHSHAATHFSDTPQLRNLVAEFLPTVESNDDYARFEIDTKREVGTSDLVETEEGDEIVYAKRPNRDTYARFVKNKKPIPTNRVTIELRTIDDQTYELFTAYIGRLTPSFPGNEFETPKSKPFWATHALVWGTQEIVPGTETIACPW